MRFVALVSGGKDSVFSIMECQRYGHELVACVHLGKKTKAATSTDKDKDDDGQEDDDDEEEESYMYQSAASECVAKIVQECIGVPLILVERQGTSVNTNLVYENTDTNVNDSNDDNGDTNERTATSATTAGTGNDEVEDLYRALLQAKLQFPQIRGVCSGAILSTYQRTRIESVCQRLRLQSLSYLWRSNSQQHLLQRMIFEARIDAVLVKVAAPPGLRSDRHLNRSIASLQPHFLNLNRKYQFHVCGEGGEYETLVLDCPLYRHKKLVLDDVEIVQDPSDPDIGVLLIHSCHTEKKFRDKQEEEEEHVETDVKSNSNNNNNKDDECTKNASTNERDDGGDGGDGDHSRRVGNSSGASAPTADANGTVAGTSSRAYRRLPSSSFRYLPRVRRVPGGLFHVHEVLATSAAADSADGRSDTSTATSPPTASEAELAVREAIEIFQILDDILRIHRCTQFDILMVHLYLSEMSHFAPINQHYRDYFGTVMPPSRSCISVGNAGVLPGRRRVMLDCVVQCGSGAYMRTGAGANGSRQDNPYTHAAKIMNGHTKLRNVLHVQSISNWAPVCVGPYSQVNTYMDCIHFFAGQIGLKPYNMTLHNTWQRQLEQTWANIANVFDALNNGCLDQILSGLVYVTTSTYHSEKTENDSIDASFNVIREIEQICCSQRKTNAGVVPGSVDGSKTKSSTTDDYFGYEDEGTMRELLGEEEIASLISQKKRDQVPLLLVVVPELPVGALIEVEVIGATADAATYLPRTLSSSHQAVCSNPLRDCSVERMLGWATGHDFLIESSSLDAAPHNGNVYLNSHICSVAFGAIVCGIVTASIIDTDSNHNDCNAAMPIPVDCGSLLKDMLSLLNEDSSACDRTSNAVTPSIPCWLHIRLNYVTSQNQGPVDDGMMIRIAFESALGSFTTKYEGSSPPTVTCIPVEAIHLLSNGHGRNGEKESETPTTFGKHRTFFAIQAFAIDPVQAQTELWIHRGREDS